jgi:hypothetical protein
VRRGVSGSSSSTSRASSTGTVPVGDAGATTSESLSAGSVFGASGVSSPDAFFFAATPAAAAAATPAAPAIAVFAEIPLLPLSPCEAAAASTPGVPASPGTVPRQAPDS